MSQVRETQRGEMIQDSSVRSLTDQQIEAAQLIASGGTCKEVSVKVGVTPAAVANWMKRSDFQSEIEMIRYKAKAIQRDSAVQRWQDMEDEAVSVLRELMGEDNKPEVRLKAAQTVLNAVQKAKDDNTGSVEVVFNSMPAPVMPEAQIEGTN